jgi:D-glycero-alpha-D-manno-heptose-7-phosphate kinase
MFKYLNEIQFQEDLSLCEVMDHFSTTAIHTQGTGFGIVVSHQGKCIGVVTDGDIRRALVAGGGMDQPIKQAMTEDFTFARSDFSRHQILRLLDQQIKHVPVLDENDFIVDLFQFNDFNASVHNEEKIIRSRAPVRVSFGGGGTDMSFYFKDRVGVVLSSTINKYSYATIAVRSDQTITLNSREFGQKVEADCLNDLQYDGQLDLIKACAKVMNPDFGFDLETFSEVEPGTGLGGSAAISSAVIGAFNHFRNENHLNRYHLADLAYQAERVELGIEGGWQDQYAAVFGGINLIEFRKDEIIVYPLRMPEEILLELHLNLLLFRVGKSRDSGRIVSDQKQKFQSGSAELKQCYDHLANLTLKMKDELLKGDLRSFGASLDSGWQIKKRFTEKISNSFTDQLYDEAKRLGALGGKLTGAGGGGYLLIYCEPHLHAEIIGHLEEMGAQWETFDFVDHGAQVWTASK